MDTSRQSLVVGPVTAQPSPAAAIDGVVIFLVTSLAMNAGDPLLALAG
jgi:hypothetical protein